MKMKLSIFVSLITASIAHDIAFKKQLFRIERFDMIVIGFNEPVVKGYISIEDMSCMVIDDDDEQSLGSLLNNEIEPGRMKKLDGFEAAAIKCRPNQDAETSSMSIYNSVDYPRDVTVISLKEIFMVSELDVIKGTSTYEKISYRVQHPYIYFFLSSYVSDGYVEVENMYCDVQAMTRNGTIALLDTNPFRRTLSSIISVYRAYPSQSISIPEFQRIHLKCRNVSPDRSLIHIYLPEDAIVDMDVFHGNQHQPVSSEQVWLPF